MTPLVCALLETEFSYFGISVIPREYGKHLRVEARVTALQILLQCILALQPEPPSIRRLSQGMYV